VGTSDEDLLGRVADSREVYDATGLLEDLVCGGSDEESVLSLRKGDTELSERGRELFILVLDVGDDRLDLLLVSFDFDGQITVGQSCALVFTGGLLLHSFPYGRGWNVDLDQTSSNSLLQFLGLDSSRTGDEWVVVRRDSLDRRGSLGDFARDQTEDLGFGILASDRWTSHSDLDLRLVVLVVRSGIRSLFFGVVGGQSVSSGNIDFALGRVGDSLQCCAFGTDDCAESGNGDLDFDRDRLGETTLDHPFGVGESLLIGGLDQERLQASPHLSRALYDGASSVLNLLDSLVDDLDAGVDVGQIEREAIGERVASSGWSSSSTETTGTGVSDSAALGRLDGRWLGSPAGDGGFGNVGDGTGRAAQGREGIFGRGVDRSSVGVGGRRAVGGSGFTSRRGRFTT
jgi:hypothetical protein